MTKFAKEKQQKPDFDKTNDFFRGKTNPKTAPRPQRIRFTQHKG